ncbi:MAG: cytochrome c oxidase subunit 4 [Actinomycetota bacterium]|nr:cytochrome c oxidase subunit 4 [Actinomycetota bacterium]
MAEELRFFLRSALFTILIGTIYWFISYEEAGSLLLAGVVVSSLFFFGIVAVSVRATRRGGKNVRALFGFADSPHDRPLMLDEDVFPTASAWPVVASVGLVLIGLGLIYGGWLWIPGAGVAFASGWGWLSETD